MKPINKVLDAIPGPKKKLHGQYICLCPAHKDREPSLSVRKMTNSTVLMHCFAGCDIENILERIGLNFSDLFWNHLESNQSEIETTYDYLNADGILAYQVIRLIPKDFRVRRPKSSGGWEWNMKGTELIPYRLPFLLKAIERNEQIIIAEGEKDCDNLVRLGFVATCNPFGAGKWRDSFSVYFKNARVVIIPDEDIAGKKHALDIARKLLNVVTSIKVVDLNAN